MAQDSRTKLVLVMDVEGAQAKKTLDAIGDEGFEAAKKAGDEFARMNRDLRKLEGRGKKTANGLKKAWRGFGRMMKSSVLPALLLVVAGFIGLQAIAGATRNAQNFQLAMGEVATILPGAAAGTEDLATAVRKLAIAQGENESVVAKGLYQTISAGVSDSADALELMGVAGRLAVAGLASTNEVVDLLTTGINAFGLEIGEADRLADIFFATVRDGKTTISEMASSISVALPGANALGIGIEEVTGALAALTQQGFNTSESATRLASLWKALLTRGSELDTLFRERLGTSYDISTVKARGLFAVLQDIRGALKDDSEALDVLGARQEAFQALLGLTGDKAALFTRTLNGTTNAAGTLAEVFDRIAGTDGFKLKQAVQAIRDGFLELGDAILKAAADAIEQLGGLEALNQRFKNLATVMAPLITNLISGAADLSERFLDVGASIEESTLRAQIFAAEINNTMEALGRMSGLGKDSGLGMQRGQLEFVQEQGRAAGQRGLTPGAASSFPSLDKALLELEEMRGFMADARGTSMFRVWAEDVRDAEGRVRDLATAALQTMDSMAAAEAELNVERDAGLQTMRERLAVLERERLLGKPSAPAVGGGDFSAVAALFPSAREVGQALGEGIDAGLALAQQHSTAVAAAILGQWELVGVEIAKAMQPAVAPNTQSTEQAMALQEVMLGLRGQGLGASDFGGQNQLLQETLRLEAQKLELLLQQVDATDQQRAAAKLAFSDAAQAQQGGLLDQQERQKDQTLKSTEAWKAFSKQQQFVKSAVEGTASSIAFGMEDALLGLITGTQSASEAFKSFVSGMVVDLIRLAIRLTVTNWLLTFFNGLIGNVGSISVASFMAANMLGGLGQAAMAASAINSQTAEAANGAVFGGGFQAFAAGGIVTRPTLGLVGEGAMNEAVVPLPNGREIGVDLKGGGGTTVNVSLSAIDPSSGMQFLQSHANTLGDMVTDRIHRNRDTILAVRGATGGRGLTS